MILVKIGWLLYDVLSVILGIEGIKSVCVSIDSKQYGCKNFGTSCKWTPSCKASPARNIFSKLRAKVRMCKI